MNAQRDLKVILDLGFGVFPCRTTTLDDKRKVKAPLTIHGKDDATSDSRQIEAWLREYGSPAWGARPPRGTTVLDIDTKNADGFQTLADLEREHGELPPTLTSRTPSAGEHRIFSTPANYKNRAGVRPGLDVRSNGGYILVPPSVIDAGAYQWRDPTVSVAAAPDWLIDQVFAYEKRPSKGRNKQHSAADVIEHGTRNDTVFRYACSLRGRNITREEAWNLHSAHLRPDFALFSRRGQLAAAGRFTPGR